MTALFVKITCQNSLNRVRVSHVLVATSPGERKRAQLSARGYVIFHYSTTLFELFCCLHRQRFPMGYIGCRRSCVIKTMDLWIESSSCIYIKSNPGMQRIRCDARCSTQSCVRLNPQRQEYYLPHLVPVARSCPVSQLHDETCFGKGRL